MAQTKEERTQRGIEYRKTHVRQVKLDLSLEYDADILAYLDALPNRTGYLKALIRADIARAKSEPDGSAQNVEEEKTMKYTVEYTDPNTGATSPIDTVTAPVGYTAEAYISDCDRNADREWCEMLHAGTVALVPVEDE